jgi:UDP-N-acetyl-D-mannosaminuronic acid dehydrogenase
MTDQLNKLLERRGPIKKVGVVGMGYVGIPSALLFADSPNFEQVWGFQRNSPSSGYKIDMLNKGECPIGGKEPELQDLLEKVVRNRKFRCTADMSKIAEVDAVTIAVETDFHNLENLEPDFNALNEGLQNIARFISPGTLVVVESTITPGLTAGKVREILENESGLRAGEDFALAHAPERLMPGKLIRNIRELDRVVGGIDEASTERACELYTPIMTKGNIIRMSATAAELTKTAENAFRDLQIAAANEMAIYCETLGVNFYQIKAAINSLKGEGVSRAVLFPGAGVGGHCLPKDSYHMLRSVQTIQRPVDFPEKAQSLFILARKINDFMPRHMCHLTLSALKSLGKSPKGAKVALLGWAYRENTDDQRNTPSELYRKLLVSKGAKVRVHDPYARDSGRVKIFKNLERVLDDADVISIFTAHDTYLGLDLDKIKGLSGKSHPIIVDGRNVIDPDSALQRGFVYRGIGRGDKRVTGF